MSEINPNSILQSVKKLLGPAYDDNAFDLDIIVQINTAFSILTDIGVGPKTGFAISDDTAVWNDFINVEDDPVFNKVKTFIQLKAKLYFDPPTNSSLLAAMQESIKELEWRLNVNGDEAGMDS